jgi:hypothetical protein
MNARSKELQSTQSHFGYRFLYDDTIIKDIPESRYFVSLGNPYSDSDTDRLIEAYTWNNGYQIKMQIMASDARNSITFKDDPTVRNDPAMTDAPAKSRTLVSLMSRARGRPDDEIPGEPGVCFQGGFLRGSSWERENVSAEFSLRDHQDVSIELDTNSYIQESDTLLERGNEIQRDLKSFDGQSIRRGVVDTPHFHAEEWLVSLTDSGIRGYRFALEANSKIGSPKTPLVSLTMDVGLPKPPLDAKQPEKASLTEAEAIGAWDAISRSLRPRPNAF